MRMLFVLCFCYLMSSPSLRAVELKITTTEHEYPVATTVISAEVPVGVSPEAKSFVLVSDAGDKVIAQRDFSSTSQMLWLLEKPLAQGQSRSYRFTTEVPDQTDAVTCNASGPDRVIKVQGKPVLQYNAVLKECPVEGFAECRRSGFIHPLYAPDGTVVSDDFPPEHAHQHGIMFAWTHTSFRGREIDFWNSMKKLGITEHGEVLACESGPVFAELQVKINHVALSQEGERQPALAETWRVRVFNCADPFLIDIQSTQATSSKEPLHILEYHYGGMAFRGARPWSFGKAEFLTSLGGDRESGNHTRPLWTAISGEVDGRPYTFVGAGLPTNFRHPQPVRLHPDMPYFCWSPEVLGEFEIAPGNVYRSEYRFLVQQGSPDAKVFDTWQEALADPPHVEIVN